MQPCGLQDIQMLLEDGEAQRWQNVNSKMKDRKMLLEDGEAWWWQNMNS